jgi:hypothetical protein
MITSITLRNKIIENLLLEKRHIRVYLKNESRPLIKIKDLNKKWDHAERNHEHYCFLIQKRFKASTVISLNRIE